MAKISLDQIIENAKINNDISLELIDAEIEELPEKIGELKELRVLTLNSSSIKKLPNSIGDLINLNLLDLSYNRIEKLPESFSNLTNLQLLYLKNNQISEMPENVIMMTQLVELDLVGNPIENIPPEIIAKGLSSIRNYYSKLKDNKKCFEAKILIVGQGNVGKTFLLNRLVYNKVDYQSQSTEGIDIKKWITRTPNFDNFRINFWDFGGQEIYHATHQFFLTKRSLYIFVWEARSDDDITFFDYWLNVIKILSLSSPIIIVMNKSDERTKNLDEQTFKENFPNIKSFHKVSAIKGSGIDDLRKEILIQIEKLDHIGSLLPKAWVDIRAELEKCGKDFISYGDYLVICHKYGFNEDDAKFLRSGFITSPRLS
jgi:internalin A